MASGPETRLQRRIRRALENHGGSDLYHFKEHGGPHGTAGVPDLICCYRGHFVALEVKVPPNTATAKQEHHIELIRRAGGHAFVVTTSDEAVRVLKLIDKAAA